MKYIRILCLLVVIPLLSNAQSIINTDVYIGPGTDMYFEGDDAEIGPLGIVHSNGAFGTSLKIINGGTMMGTGSFEIGTSMDNVGTMAPGGSPGIITINGSYNNGVGVMEIELGGTVVGSTYDRLEAKNSSPLIGSVTLGGSLSVVFVNGFIPVGGNTFTIITADAGVTGTFANVSIPDVPLLTKHITYNANSVVISYTTTALPVQLISFNGKKTGLNESTLDWVTAKEKEFKGFEIQKSKDAKTFEAIGFVSGKVNQNNYLNTYQFVDKDVTFAINYYRLKLIDEDNSFAYSKIISIDNALEQSVIGSFYPNPTFDSRSQIDIVTKEKGDWVISHYNLAGVMLRFDVMPLEKGLNKVAIDNLNTGVNFIRLQGKDIVEVRKVVKE